MVNPDIGWYNLRSLIVYFRYINIRIFITIISRYRVIFIVYLYTSLSLHRHLIFMNVILHLKVYDIAIIRIMMVTANRRLSLRLCIDVGSWRSRLQWRWQVNSGFRMALLFSGTAVGLEPKGRFDVPPWQWILECRIMCGYTIVRSLHSIRTPHA